jgi:hypothetical protein
MILTDRALTWYRILYTAVRVWVIVQCAINKKEMGASCFNNIILFKRRSGYEHLEATVVSERSKYFNNTI